MSSTGEVIGIDRHLGSAYAKAELGAGNILPNKGNIFISVNDADKKGILKIFGKNHNTKDGTCIRDYIHVLDLADAHIKALDFLDNKDNLFVNLSTGCGSSVLEIVNETEKVTGLKINYSLA